MLPSEVLLHELRSFLPSVPLAIGFIIALLLALLIYVNQKKSLPAGEIVVTNQKLLIEVEERKQTGIALQKSEQRLRDLIDGLGPSIFVGLMTPDGILIEANRPALTMAGLKPDDVLGKPIEETYWWSYSKEVKHQLREAVARAAHGEASSYDVQVRAAEKPTHHRGRCHA